MTSYLGEPDFAHDTPGCTGVLLTNLGTPDAPTPAALRRYLGEFLWDPRVIEIPRPLWWLILHGIVLRTRPRRAAHAYQQIWTPEGSPLLQITRRQAAALQERLSARFEGPLEVAIGMRYGQPSIREGLEALRRAAARRILVLPLYPQYSASTTGSTFDALAQALQTWRWIPELRMVQHYHDEPAYIEVLANTVREHWEAHGRARRLLLSFHGLPKRYFLAGDPYFCECQKTARLVAERLELGRDEWQVVFQSRFGREEWLQPYTDETLQRLAREGVESVDMICPGFSADCLETLEEIAQQNRELFLTAGGREYRYIPALNERPDHIDALAALCMRHLQGWPGSASQWPTGHSAAAGEARRQRALAMGAER
jgi:protoporphyrin/coproporphyrin ferrochelatase